MFIATQKNMSVIISYSVIYENISQKIIYKEQVF